MVLLALFTALAPASGFAQSLLDGPPASGDSQAFYAGEATIAPAATPMFTPGTPDVQPAPVAAPAMSDHARALDCMTWAIAYEAAGQPIAGQEAVGQVILNRVRDPRRPKTVCGVVFEGSEHHNACQFTFTCDGALRRHLSAGTMAIARSVAISVLDGLAPDHVAGATNYHANYVSPAWALTGRKVTQIGAHIFYLMPGHEMRAQAPVTTAAEPEFAGPTMAPAPQGMARAGRRPRMVSLSRPSGTPAGTRPLFQPWGLPVGAQQSQLSQ